MKEDSKNKFEMFRQHVDTVIILGGVLAASMWMNGKFATLEKDMAVIKAVLVMKNIMPTELARREKIVDCKHE